MIMNDKRQRIISGIFLALLVILIVKFAGLFLFKLTVSVIITIAFIEYCRMINPGFFLKNAGLIISPLLPFFTDMSPGYGFTIFSIILVSTLVILFKEIDVKNLISLCTWTFGILYIPLFLSYLVNIRLYFGNNGRSENLILYVLFILWAGDTGAMYFGKKYGKSKLAPKISPNKTIAGTVGGLFSNFVIAILFKNALFSGTTLFQAFSLGLVIGVAGQVGDLFESYIKRVYNLKDSGCVIPGHGGLLDRIDSLIFVAPIVYIMLKCGWIGI
jgi:phosphatidate cytidylyltransferase